MKRIGIVGAGTIGASWAACYAQHGYEVRIYDASKSTREAAPRTARAHLERLVELELATAEQLGQATLTAVDSLDALADGAELIQESVLETYEVKKPLYQELDKLTEPATLLASSSSGLLISEIQEVMERPERAFIAHPFNPPHLVPLVEIVRGKQTTYETIARAKVFYEELGKEPVLLNKEVPGHIANRLAAALWREALDLVANDVASVEDVDKALRAGPGLRWAIMGQHMIYHLGGGEGGYEAFIEHIGKAFETYWETMPDWTQIPEEAKRKAIAGVEAAAGDRDTADIAAERDRKLAAILKALRES